MSIEALDYVRTLKVGNPTVLMLLANHADEQFSCFPSMPLLAAEVEVTNNDDNLRMLRRSRNSRYNNGHLEGVER
ncbi:hypothetical protein [Streptomyces sp. 5-10]|uniref:hypothetical protein n=1 Tax=Streptomyces sp. 5-10 TaxID=878925 RepID=UPI00168AA138|nr:hypothetical protein [Streptomyces sp. 5-10]MBD3004530.1 hypothetical protein [Streptomyces sp. 5-10]